MIVEKKFSPVTITFESKEEIEMLRFMIGSCRETVKFSVDADFREMLRLIEKSFL